MWAFFVLPRIRVRVAFAPSLAAGLARLRRGPCAAYPSTVISVARAPRLWRICASAIHALMSRLTLDPGSYLWYGATGARTGYLLCYMHTSCPHLVHILSCTRIWCPATSPFLMFAGKAVAFFLPAELLPVPAPGCGRPSVFSRGGIAFMRLCTCTPFHLHISCPVLRDWAILPVPRCCTFPDAPTSMQLLDIYKRSALSTGILFLVSLSHHPLGRLRRKSVYILEYRTETFARSYYC
jgi:hypothetical protein